MKLSNVVYTSAALCRYPSRYPKVQATIREAVEGHGMAYREIYGIKNIWCRDFMPVPCRNGLVKFGYKGYPGATYDQFPQLQVPDECWSDLALPVEVTDLILDGGGNCVRSEHTAVITDVVYQHNARKSPGRIRQWLETLLDMDVLIIPREPGDELGHTDGILHFIGNDAAFVNDYWQNRSLREKEYGIAVDGLLQQHGITPIPFPFGYGRDGFPKISEEEFRRRFPEGDDFNPCPGYYTNFLLVEGLCLLPAFGHAMDDEAARKIEEYLPDVDVVQVDCSDLCMEGGLVNCVTWDTRE